MEKAPIKNNWGDIQDHLLNKVHIDTLSRQEKEWMLNTGKNQAKSQLTSQCKFLSQIQHFMKQVEFSQESGGTHERVIGTMDRDEMKSQTMSRLEELTETGETDMSFAKDFVRLGGFDLLAMIVLQVKDITDFNSIKKKASVIMMSFMQNNSYIQTVACSIGLPRNICITINEAIQGNRHDKAVIIECGINIMQGMLTGDYKDIKVHFFKNLKGIFLFDKLLYEALTTKSLRRILTVIADTLSNDINQYSQELQLIHEIKEQEVNYKIAQIQGKTEDSDIKRICDNILGMMPTEDIERTVSLTRSNTTESATGDDRIDFFVCEKIVDYQENIVQVSQPKTMTIQEIVQIHAKNMTNSSDDKFQVLLARNGQNVDKINCNLTLEQNSVGNNDTIILEMVNYQNQNRNQKTNTSPNKLFDNHYDYQMHDISRNIRDKFL